MQSSLVSVVIASYGRPQLVARAVRSALSQAHANVEVVVSDDASPDDTAAVLAAIADSRVRLHVQPRNVGVWENWTHALRMARGEHVVFLGDDDQLTEEFVVRHLEAFAAHPDVDAVFSPLEDRWISGELVGRMELEAGRGGVVGPEDIVRALLEAKVFFGAAMFRRRFAVKVWEETMPEGMVADWGLFLRGSIAHGMRGATCGGCTYLKTVHRNRLSSRIVEVTTLLADLCERMSRLARPGHPAISGMLRDRAAHECITLARHHASWNAMKECRGALWRSLGIKPVNPIAWSQLFQSYFTPARIARTAKAQRTGKYGQ